MRIDLKCAECGSNHFTLDEAVSDSSLIRCADCNHEIGTLGQLKQQVAAQVVSHSSPGHQIPGSE